MGTGSLEVGQSIVAEDRLGQSSSVEISDSGMSSNCISPSRMVGSSRSSVLALVGVPEPTACLFDPNPIVLPRTSCKLDVVG